jgi:hypothetical protein
MVSSHGLRPLSFTRASAFSTCLQLKCNQHRTNIVLYESNLMASSTTIANSVVSSRPAAMSSKDARTRRSCRTCMRRRVGCSYASCVACLRWRSMTRAPASYCQLETVLGSNRYFMHQYLSEFMFGMRRALRPGHSLHGCLQVRYVLGDTVG